MTLKPCMVMLGEPDNDDSCFNNLDDPNFLKRLREIDIENLPQNTHGRLEHICNTNLKFNSTKLKKTNTFCYLICEWVHKVVKYQRRKAQTYMKHQSPKRNGSPRRYGSPIKANTTITNGKINPYRQSPDANVSKVEIDLTPESRVPEDLD